MQRTKILLEPEQHRALTEIAQAEGRSLSDLLREIVADHLAHRDQDERLQQALQAIDALSWICEQVEAEHGMCATDLLAEIRAEREQDTEQVWTAQT
jgi:predicted DNA-binding ribbon-helix-helix protein